MFHSFTARFACLLVLFFASDASAGRFYLEKDRGYFKIIRHLESIGDRLTDIEARLDANMEESSAIRSELAAHREGTPERAFDVSTEYCFDLGGARTWTSGTELTGDFNVEGGAGADIYGNGVEGNVKMKTKGKIDRGFGGQLGASVTVCIQGPTIKRVAERLDARSQKLVDDTRAAAETVSDELTAVFDDLRLDPGRLEDAVDRMRGFDLELDDPIALVDSLRASIEDDLENLPLPPALRDRITDPDRGILENLSERLNDPRAIFCELRDSQLAGKNPQFKSRMQQACDEDGKDLKEVIDDINDVVWKIRDKLPDGRDRVLEMLGPNDWKQ